MKNSKANIFSKKNKKILINSIVENENLNTGNSIFAGQTSGSIDGRAYASYECMVNVEESP